MKKAVNTVSDSELLMLIREDDRHAFRVVFVRYYSLLCEYASLFVCENDAEDIVQDILVYLWIQRKYLTISTSLKAYLFIATKNRCLNLIKAGNIHAQVHKELYDNVKTNLEDSLLFSELVSIVQSKIDSLPDIYRETFKLSREESMTYNDIAAIQKISVKTVEYRISMALRILRKELKDYL